MIDATLQEVEELFDRKFEKQTIVINAAFQEMKDYIDVLDDRLGLVERRLTSIEYKIVKVENRLVLVESRLNIIEDKFVKVENKLDTVENKLDRALYTDNVTLDKRVTALELKNSA